MTDAAKLERLYTVPLGKAYDYIRIKRARRTVKLLRAFLARHMKVTETAVRISNQLNNLIWAHGIQKPPRKVKIRAIKDKDLVNAYLSDEKIVEKKPKETKKEEPKQEPKTEKKAEQKIEEKKPEDKPANATAKKPKQKESKAPANQ